MIISATNNTILSATNHTNQTRILTGLETSFIAKKTFVIFVLFVAFVVKLKCIVCLAAKHSFTRSLLTRSLLRSKPFVSYSCHSWLKKLKYLSATNHTNQTGIKKDSATIFVAQFVSYSCYSWLKKLKTLFVAKNGINKQKGLK